MSVLGPKTVRSGRYIAGFLADLLDFRGSVMLVQMLQAFVPSGSCDRATAQRVTEVAERRLLVAEQYARQSLRDSRTGGPVLLPERAERTLVDTGIFASSRARKKAVQTAAHELFAPIQIATLHRIEYVRQLIADIRDVLGPMISAIGPKAARLEQLDAALSEATAVRREALFKRAVAAMQKEFYSKLDAEIRALPRGTTSVPVQQWTGPDGFIFERIGWCERLVLGAFQHERVRLEALIDAASGELCA